MTHQGGMTRHMRRFGAAALLAGFSAFAAAEASAQQARGQFGGNSHPGMDVLSFSVQGGGFFAASSWDGGARFDDAGVFGASATFWAHRNVGIRGNFLWYSTDVLEPEATLFAANPDIFHYTADLVLRQPALTRQNQSMSWFPYLVAGVGGKTYDFEVLESETDVTGNLGLGLELRLGQEGRFGVHTEVRDYVSNFTAGGLDETLHDVVWTGGISLNF